MNLSTQQKQTKEFFEKISERWHYLAEKEIDNYFNIIKVRNQYIYQICSSFLDNNAKILDVGCGPGNLVIDLLKKEYQAYGIDFASSMIEKAKAEASKLNLPEKNFINKSFFEYKPDTKFNLISASGFIEYLSEDEFNDFIILSKKFLEKGGFLCFQCRNRLFNCISFNDYTKAEIEIGEIENLLEECLLFNKAKNLEQLLKKNFASKVCQNLTTHSKTGKKSLKIEVEKRNQYTPFQIITKLRKNKFSITDLVPIHIHAITTGVTETNPELHTKLSYFLQTQDSFLIKLMPLASSFMITSRKNE